VEFNRFFLEAIKIAFEYAVYKLGDTYLQDPRAIEIQQYLKSAIDGKMKDECTDFTGVCLVHSHIKEKVQAVRNVNLHILMMHPDAKNRLIVEVILFMEPILSFSVLISKEASKFYDSRQQLVELVNVKTNQY